MDMSDEAINFSKEIFTGRVEKGALPDQLPYQENFFDLITALDVIEHIDNDIDSLKAMRSLTCTRRQSSDHRTCIYVSLVAT